MSIKTKPWWLRSFVQPYQWVTIWPNIYAPETYFQDKPNPLWTPILNHEAIHMMRQKEYGVTRWLFRYAVDKAFRLDEEARGIAVEVLCNPPEQREWLAKTYAEALSGPEYKKAAPNFGTAYLAIMKYVTAALSGSGTPGK